MPLKGQRDMAIDQDIAEKAKAWPFDEARRLLKRLDGKTPEKGYVLFEGNESPCRHSSRIYSELLERLHRNLES